MKNTIRKRYYERKSVEDKWQLLSDDHNVGGRWDLIVAKDTIAFFRSLGGTETTSGKKHTSVSPDRLAKSIWTLQ